MLRIEMLPAAHGDALWIEYGKAASPRRLIVDGGPGHTYEALRWRVLSLPRSERRFELLIVTHVDADHIEGIVKLLQDQELGCTFDDIWFNDWKQIEHLPDCPDLEPTLGPLHGEFLGAMIEQRPDQNWNHAWDGGLIWVPPEGELPRVELDGGLALTLLSPGRQELEKLRDAWDDVVKDAGFTPADRDAALKQLAKRKRLGPPEAQLGDEAVAGSIDNSVANRSSIAVLAEFDGRRMLLGADAHPKRLRWSLDRWRAENDDVRFVALDAFKLPHHGSKKNMTPQLLKNISCRDYLFSTSGAQFGHPDAETIDDLLEHHNPRGRARFHFNYRSRTTSPWADPAEQEKRSFEAFYPEGRRLDFYSDRETD